MSLPTWNDLTIPIAADIPYMQMWLHKQLSGLQEKIYRQVMEACLGRSAELSDCPRFSFVSHEAHPGRQFFSFDGAMVGEFSYFLRQEGDKWIAGFEFIPKTHIDHAS